MVMARDNVRLVTHTPTVIGQSPDEVNILTDPHRGVEPLAYCFCAR